LTLFQINADETGEAHNPEHVRVVETHIGKAVYSVRPYPAGAVIGEITGRVFDDDSGADDYTFEYDEKLLDPATDDQPASRGLYLIALENILSPQELTIDYNWPASHAIQCHCQQPDCRGWVVAEDELSLLI